MRALVVAALVLACGVARADTRFQLTAWNMTIKTADGSTQMTVFGDDPNKLLPSCRCVAGVWQPAKSGESATHFKGTLKALSINYPRGKSKTLTVKVRKTRYLMGANRDYRPALLAILRGSGQVIVREVTGGEWEVVGFAPQPLGDLFAAHPRWRVDAKKPPKPTPANAIVNPDADATELAKLINDYRETLKLPRVPVSKALTKVARVHVHDLTDNKPTSDKCNMHSWSSKGSWSACCYDKSKEAAKCMWAKPKEIAGFAANGYEIAASASGIAPQQALEQWQHSPAHHEVMINKGIWTKPWGAIGVAIEGDYAVAWFSEEADKK
ncbi:MAG TPA: CAP domain-containing protein [Kofleriaceae bacterium]|nr:CAP domain-containing protein [Kofleriaceae bacterium]